MKTQKLNTGINANSGSKCEAAKHHHDTKVIFLCGGKKKKQTKHFLPFLKQTKILFYNPNWLIRLRIRRACLAAASHWRFPFFFFK